MNNPAESSLQGRGVEGSGVDGRGVEGRGPRGHSLPGRSVEGSDPEGRSVSRAGVRGPSIRGALSRRESPRREPGGPDNVRPEEAPGLLKAMSPGVVDFLFRQLVAGEPAEDVPWQREGAALSAQPPGAELARRLAETDVEALTPAELFQYVRAAQRLAVWAEGIREAAVSRYCATPSSRVAPPGWDPAPGRVLQDPPPRAGQPRGCPPGARVPRMAG